MSTVHLRIGTLVNLMLPLTNRRDVATPLQESGSTGKAVDALADTPLSSKLCQPRCYYAMTVSCAWPEKLHYAHG